MPVALYCLLKPFAMFVSWGLICSAVIEASLIVMPSLAVEAVFPWKLAVIVVLPLLSPLAKPVALTLAIDSSALS